MTMITTEIKSEFQFISVRGDLWFTFETRNGIPYVVREFLWTNPLTLGSEHKTVAVQTTKELGNRLYKILKQDLDIFGCRAEGFAMADRHFNDFYLQATGRFCSTGC